MNLINHPAPLFDAPAFSISKGHHTVSLENLKGTWVLLFFYPLDFTFVCPTELKELEKNFTEFKKREVEVLTVSVDSTYSHEAWVKGDLKKVSYTMVSDIKKRLSRDYGVLDEEAGVSLRAVFIIDPEGNVQYQLCHNLKVGRNIPELLNVVDALKSGEMCFANWKR